MGRLKNHAASRERSERTRRDLRRNQKMRDLLMLAHGHVLSMTTDPALAALIAKELGWDCNLSLKRYADARARIGATDA